MTQTVLPQLEEIESDLAAQEAAVAAQLSEVQQKLAGIRTVLPLFDGSPSAVPLSAITLNAATETTPTLKADTTTKTAASAPKAVSSGAKKATKASKTGGKRGRKRKDGRTAAWQKYTQPDMRDKSIPDAVQLILETEPTKSFKIAEVMAALFKEDMPKSQYLKARNRISNVLSGGVRDGEWYRGARSTYSMTEQ